MRASDPEVLVVGAGPTGLLTACELARRGASVRLIEKRLERQPISKALVIQARTLEVMDIIGLADEFLKRGYPAPGLNMSLDNKSPVSIEMRNLPTRFPYLLILPQQDTEEILEAHLSALGIEIERGLTLERVTQTDSGVAAYVRAADDREEHIRSSYLVACDGSHSAVRQSLGVPFEGREVDYIIFLADVKLDRHFNKARISNYTSTRGFLSVLPFLGDYARIFAVDFIKQDKAEGDALTLIDLQETIDAIAPFKLKLAEPRWITRFRSPSREVPSNRYGSVFFAGDAAHAHSPAGGQGMNNGLQDAFNLSWKLAMVLREDCPDALLDTYDFERHPIDHDAQRKTDLMFDSFTLRNRVLKAIRNVAIRTFIPLPSVQRKLAADLSGIGVTYGGTQLYRHRQRMHSGTRIKPGDRLPDVELWTASQSFSRLYELLREPGYVLLASLQTRNLPIRRSELKALILSIRDKFGTTVRSFIVLDEGMPGELEDWAPVLVDFKGQFRSRISSDAECVFLVRPDGYLAFVNRGLKFEDASPAFNEWARA